LNLRRLLKLNKTTTTMLQRLRNNFLAGFFVLLPFAVTIAVVQFILQKIGGGPSVLLYKYVLVKYELLNAVPEQPDFDEYVQQNLVIGYTLKFISTIIVLVVIAVLGFFSRYFIGKFFVGLTDRIVSNVPLINTIYNTAKQIVQTFSTEKRAVFQKVVLIEYPKSNSFAIGFLTGRAAGEIPTKADIGPLLNIFIPTTPNPTSGFLLMLPEKDVVLLDMTVGEAMKLIISGGAVIPEWNQDGDVKSIKSN
jgi:uncharacterized membrane protein